MSQPRTCLACGRHGYDVTMRLVEIPDSEARQVDIFLPLDKSDTTTPIPVTTRETYVNEPRCVDSDACRERTLAIEEER